MNKKPICGIVIVLLLTSIGLIAKAHAANDYDIRIEITPTSILQGETVTFRIHADLVGYDDYTTPNGALVSVSIRGFPAPNTAGIFVYYPDGTFTNYRNDLSPITIQNGVPSEAEDYVDITFGTNAPDKDKFSPPSSTDLLGIYSADFAGFVYMSDGSQHWFDIPKFHCFEVTPHPPPPGECWNGYTIGWWKENAAKLLSGRQGTQLTLEEYEAAVDCAYDEWHEDLPWLPTSVEGALAIFDARRDSVTKAQMQLLAFLLSLCHFGEDFDPVTIIGTAGTYTFTPAEWATFLIDQYNMGNFAIVYEYANALNNY